MLKYANLIANSYGTYNTKTQYAKTGLRVSDKKKERTVTRTWITKSGEVKTKTYHYGKANKKSRTKASQINDLKLLTKTGKFKSKLSLEQIVNKYGGGLPQKEEFIRNTLMTYSLELHKTISLGTLTQMWNHDKLTIFLSNMGITLSDLVIAIKIQAPDLVVDESMVGDASNWSAFEYDPEDARKGSGTLHIQGREIVLDYNYWTRVWYVEVK